MHSYICIQIHLKKIRKHTKAYCNAQAQLQQHGMELHGSIGFHLSLLACTWLQLIMLAQPAQTWHINSILRCGNMGGQHDSATPVPAQKQSRHIFSRINPRCNAWLLEVIRDMQLRCQGTYAKGDVSFNGPQKLLTRTKCNHIRHQGGLQHCLPVSWLSIWANAPAPQHMHKAHCSMCITA
jgi:hypothetical protein